MFQSIRPRRLFAIVLGALALSALTSPLTASGAAAQDDLAHARTLLAEGAYEAAYDAGAADGSAEGLRLAAEALNAALMEDLDGPSDGDAVRRTRGAADDALEADPDSVQGKLLVASAMWFQGREVGNLAGFMRGLPQNARQMLEEAAEAGPENGRAWAMLGLWHIDVIRRGGENGARRLNADLDLGLSYWDAGMRLAPDDIAMAVHGAHVLLALDPEAHADRAHAALERALAGSPQTSLERAMQTRGERLAALSGDERDAALMAWVGR